MASPPQAQISPTLLNRSATVFLFNSIKTSGIDTEIIIKKNQLEKKVAEISPQYHHSKSYLKGKMSSEGQNVNRQNTEIKFKIELNIFEKCL